MILNEEKTKCMIFNFNKNKQFSTRLVLNGKKIETVNEIKLLGTIITNNLKWDKNTKLLVKRAYSRMEILRQMSKFTNSVKDKVQIYKAYIRSVIEQSSVVWGQAIAQKNKSELERVQKVAVSLMTNSKDPYKVKLKQLNLETLQARRDKLSLRFSENCVKNPRTKTMFKENKKEHKMKLRRKEKFFITPVRTVGLQKSAKPTMARHMNKKHEENQLMITNITNDI